MYLVVNFLGKNLNEPMHHYTYFIHLKNGDVEIDFKRVINEAFNFDSVCINDVYLSSQKPSNW